MLTRLNAIQGVEGSSALIANDGNRIVQIKIRKGANATKVIEEVQKAMRAEIQNETPLQLDGKSAAALGQNQDWLTISQLNTLAIEEDSPGGFNLGFWLLALLVLLALCALIFWLLRRQRSVRQKSKVRLA